jgi:O-antigen/teichoic acid export membrane protein
MSKWLVITRKTITSSFSKELIVFSLPLLGTAVLGFIFSTTDKLMLGGFKGAADVGLYSVAISLAPFISFPLGILVIVFIPIFSGMYAKGLLEEMRRNYSILTKWLCSASLPLFIILFLFPEPVLNVLFGFNYVPAALTLRILAFAYIINNFVGPCGATLLALGETKFIMIATLVSAIINVTLNGLLIPPYGLIGAAVATGFAVVFVNLLRVWKIYSLNKIHPISKNLIKPTILSIIIIVAFYFVSKPFLIYNWWSLLLLLILFYVIYIISMLITKSLDKEDLMILLALEKKTGIKSTLIRKIITKFLKN